MKQNCKICKKVYLNPPCERYLNGPKETEDTCLCRKCSFDERYCEICVSCLDTELGRVYCTIKKFHLVNIIFGISPILSLLLRYDPNSSSDCAFCKSLTNFHTEVSHDTAVGRCSNEISTCCRCYESLINIKSPDFIKPLKEIFDSDLKEYHRFLKISGTTIVSTERSQDTEFQRCIYCGDISKCVFEYLFQNGEMRYLKRYLSCLDCQNFDLKDI